jgi:hypothetical protein
MKKMHPFEAFLILTHEDVPICVRLHEEDAVANCDEKKRGERIQRVLITPVPLPGRKGGQTNGK